MYEELMKFNRWMLPLHIFMYLVMCLGMYVGVSHGHWFLDGLLLSVQVHFLSSIPLLIFYFKRRKKASFLSLLKVLGIYFLPYVLIVLLFGEAAHI